MNETTGKKRLILNISGLVQGVFFREGARGAAERLGINGSARNEPDGTVTIDAEGYKKELDAFLSWCHHGPPLAQVKKVKMRKAPLKNFKRFSV
jgi:acylphosphatase